MRPGEGACHPPGVVYAGARVIVLQHILLALCLAALAGAGVRMATFLGASGLVRVLVAVVAAAALAVLQALLLSTVALGGSPAALAALAGATWLAARLVLPDLGRRPSAELAAWWASAAPAVRFGLVAALGAWAAWALWLARWPVLGADSMIYHVPEIIEWIHEGTPGSISSIFVGYPVGNYPVTNEVLMTWPTAIARSFAPVVAWAPAAMLLLATAGWVGLRELRVPRVPAILAVGTMCLTPAVSHWQKNGAHTDLPTLAWLACTAALCAASAKRPLLAAPMLVSAALGVGTKTTTLPLTALLIVIAAVIHRHRLRELAVPLAVAAGVGVLVGGFWYLRNLVLHGSPMWPFVATPWGDPVPKIVDPTGRVVEDVYNSFLDRPRQTIDYIFRDQARPFLGGIVMLGAALAAPLVVRRKAVLAAAGVAALSLLIWMNAPFTGVWQDDVSKSAPLTTMRYLVPCWAVAALTLALASRETRAGRIYATAALGLALAITSWQLFDLGYPSVPGPENVVAGAVVAVVLAGLAMLVLPRSIDWPRVLAAGAVPAVVAAGAVSTLAGSGFVDRYIRAIDADPASAISAGTDMFRWFQARPDFEDGEEPIAFNAVMNAALSGDRLQHRVDHIDPRESCGKTVGRLEEGWIVFNRTWRLPEPCLAGRRPVWEGGEFRVYARPELARAERR